MNSTVKSQISTIAAVSLFGLLDPQNMSEKHRLPTLHRTARSDDLDRMAGTPLSTSLLSKFDGIGFW